MNCIIIDDDDLSRKLLEKFVEKTEFFDRYYAFPNAIEAINFIRKKTDTIDVIFLDIEMPEMNGVEFMQSLNSEALVQVIVVSSKEKYALDAIEYDVTDYLLKPVTYVRFLKAAEKSLTRYNDSLTANVVTESSSEDFFIRSNSNLIRLRYDDVIWIEAMENYVVVNTFDDRFTIHGTIKAIVDQLPSSSFFRIHRSFVVNKNCIEVIKVNTVEVKTSEGLQSLPLGKVYRDQLLKDINMLNK